MISTLRIFYPPSSDNATLLPVVVLNVNARRYIFNAPEGATRAMKQRGLRGMGRSDVQLFLPTVGSHSGGTPGLIMTLADGGCRSLTVHGPSQLAQWLISMRFYVLRDQLLLNCNEADPARADAGSTGSGRRSEGSSAFYKDECVTVHAVPLVHPAFEDFVRANHKRRKTRGTNGRSQRSSRSPSGRASRSASPEGASDAERDWPALFRQVWPVGPDGAAAPRQTTRRMDLNSPGPFFEPGPAHALSYIVEHPPQRGKFEAQVANDLGVPQGPTRAALIKEGSIRFQRPVQWAQMPEQERKAWMQKAAKQDHDAKQGKGKGKGKGKGQQKSKAAVQTGSGASAPQAADAAAPAVECEEVEVQASQVLGETKAGTAFIQLYVPSAEFLPSLLTPDNQRRFERYFAGAKDGVRPALILHAAPPDVLSDARYRSFVERFGPDMKHLISSPGYSSDTHAFSSAVLSHLRLSQLDSKIWTPIRYGLSPSRDIAALNLPGAQAVPPELFVSLVPPLPFEEPPSSAPDLLAPLDDPLTQAAMAFRARPPAAKKVQQASQLARESAWAEFLRMSESLRAPVDEEARERAKAKDADFGLVLTPLGTGSAMPSKYRNVSGTLVHAPGGDGYMLLDAGEGTYGQLCRRFGNGSAEHYEGGVRDAPRDALEPSGGIDEVLRELRIMFLSHIHGDHHIGAARILAARHKLRPERPLYIVANRSLQRYLEEYAQCESLGIGHSVIFLQSSDLDFDTGGLHAPAGDAQMADAGGDGRSSRRPWLDHEARQNYRDALASMGLLELSTCKVVHRIPHCYGLVARAARGWSLAYSGDTQPCEALVRAGRDVDVLVHEATLEDSQAEMAAFKGHSTFGQAIEVARQMNAKHCLLTHFSQRYPKLPRLSAPGAEAQSGRREPIIALSFDLASIAVRDMWKMERYRPALELLFDADEDVEDGADGDTASLANAEGAAGDVQMADASAAAPGGADALAKKERAAVQQPPATAVDAPPASKEARVDAAGPPAYDRFNVKGSESAYIALRLSLPRPFPGPCAAPSAAAVHEACQRAVERVHGLVGGAFVIDVLHVRPGSGSGADSGRSCEAVLRVASEYLAPLLSALSIELKLAVPEAPQPTNWRSAVRAISAASGLGHMALSDSRAWLRENAP